MDFWTTVEDRDCHVLGFGTVCEIIVARFGAKPESRLRFGNTNIRGGMIKLIYPDLVIVLDRVTHGFIVVENFVDFLDISINNHEIRSLSAWKSLDEVVLHHPHTAVFVDINLHFDRFANQRCEGEDMLESILDRKLKCNQ